MTAREVLDGIKGQLGAATPGPWKADTGVRGDCVVWGPNGRFLMNLQSEPHWLEYPGETRMVSFDVDARDATFIASAPSTVSRLTEAVESVLSLHTEVMFRGHLSNGCRVCGGGEGWPCPTITAIENALEPK